MCGRFSKHPETDFSRNRKIRFQSLIHFYYSTDEQLTLMNSDHGISSSIPSGSFL